MKHSRTIAAAAIALGLLASLPADAATGGLSYSPPTTYEDDTPLPASAIAGYNVRCASFTPTGGSAGTCPTIAPTSLPGNATGGTITLTIPGTGGVACFQVQTVATNGAVSPWSNQACKTFAPLTPNPPSNVTVAVVIGINMAPVYSVTSTGKMSTLMGFADLGAPCDEAELFTYRGLSFHEVAREHVRWWGSTKLRVAAPCAAPDAGQAAG